MRRLVVTLQEQQAEAAKLDAVIAASLQEFGMAGDGWRYLTIDVIKAKSATAIAIGPFGSRMKSDRYVPVDIPVIRRNNISDTRELVGDFSLCCTRDCRRTARE